METLCPESGLGTAPNWPKIWKETMTSQFSDMTSNVRFFDVLLFVLSRLVTDPSFMSISSLVLELWQYYFIRDWPEIGNTPVWVLPNIWRLDWVMDTTFVTNVSNRMLLNAAKFQGYSVYHFWVIKGKPTEGNLNWWTLLFHLLSHTFFRVPVYPCFETHVILKDIFFIYF